MRRLAVLCAVATAALVVGPLQAGATAPLSPGKYVSTVLSFYDQVAAIVHKDSGSCGKMVVDLQKFGNTNKAKIAQVEASSPKITKAEAAAIVAADEGKFAQAAQTIGQGIAACATKPGVASILGQLNKLKK